MVSTRMTSNVQTGSIISFFTVSMNRRAWTLPSRLLIVGIVIPAIRCMTVGSNTLRYFAGFDLGTSGARISIVQPSGSSFQQVHEKSVTWNKDDAKYDDPNAWWNAISSLLQGVTTIDRTLIGAICISGTSASCLMVDPRPPNEMKVTRWPRMYNYNVQVQAGGNEASTAALELLDKHAPPRHTARAPTGSLAKLLTWAIESPIASNHEVFCHQADYIAMRLLDTNSNSISTTNPSYSDWHNCLKLGYDVQHQCWPTWFWNCLQEAGIEKSVIPSTVVSPGTPLGTIETSVAQALGLSAATVIVAGTTDSNAAFLAAAGTSPSLGTAVTSLGSTLAMKQLSRTYVEDADRGVYSHRFPTFKTTRDHEKKNDDETPLWLVGGASNVGCAILRKLQYSNEELAEWSCQIDPEIDSPYQYYPLIQKGERFPIADSDREPILDPIPSSRKDYLHGLLQSIGDVERDGFAVLQELGAPAPTIVYTSGGGSKNPMWTRLRERRLREKFGIDIGVYPADSTEPSYGAALLAAATF